LAMRAAASTSEVGGSAPTASPSSLNPLPSAPAAGADEPTPRLFKAPLVRPAVVGTARPSAAMSPPASATGAVPSTLASASVAAAAAEEIEVFRAMWTKQSNKKHKVYSDGVVIIRGGVLCVLKDLSGRDIAQTRQYGRSALADLKMGSLLEVGAKDVELMDRVDPEHYRSGAIFIDFDRPAAPPPAAASDSAKRVATAVAAVPPAGVVRRAFVPPIPTRPSCGPASADGMMPAPAPAPLPRAPTPRYDPDSLPNAFVLYDPRSDGNVDGRPSAAVVVDPFLDRNLHLHQRDGVLFMFSCLTGIRHGAAAVPLQQRASGCILADEMGLGKSLQALALLWTMLKQGPHGVPLVRKALIIAPSSLTKNWKAEIRRWLGAERLRPLVVGDESSKKAAASSLIDDFCVGHHPVLVISYEQFRIYADRLIALKSIGLVVLDEGHRLKNADSKITTLIAALPTRRRVILSGSPIQNNLEEFYVMCQLVEPEFMDISQFRDLFVRPMMRMHDAAAKPAEMELASARSAELARRTAAFMLRRTRDILMRFLPPRNEYVLFCRLTDSQRALYHEVLRGREVSSLLSGMPGGDVMTTMMVLRQICDHPCLRLKNLAPCATDDGEGIVTVADEAADADVLPWSLWSSKFAATAEILRRVRSGGSRQDKVVVTCSYRSTLALLERLCAKAGYPYVRLDGTTPIATRQEIVDRFNDPAGDVFVFLLSLRAGNAGFNLVAANRMVLFDGDWNPAITQQAMGRVWRLGQKREVHIYRLVCAGTIEEKIFQRNMLKVDLAQAVLMAEGLAADPSAVAAASAGRFSPDELRAIFSYDDRAVCDTHASLRCRCRSSGEIQTDTDYRHFADMRGCQDPVVVPVARSAEEDAGAAVDQLEAAVSFVFASRTAMSSSS
jgi:superfamily II DNA or RNA helicase